MIERAKLVSIVVTGAIAPGVNNVISSIVIGALENGWNVIGFHDGYEALVNGTLKEIESKKVILNKDVAMSIVNTAGSFLRVSRFGTVFTDEDVKTICERIKELNVDGFVSISSHENLSMSHRIAEYFKGSNVQALVVPKTIDNDIPLDESMLSFGFSTAKSVGVQLVNCLTAETHSVPRYFVVETMGKRTGHLALEIAAGASAALSVIPEDFGIKKVSLEQICDFVQIALVKRLIKGDEIGIIVVSESLIYSLDEESLKIIYPNGVERNKHGDLDLDAGDIGVHISDTVRDRFNKVGVPLRFCPKKFGYELRGAKPVAEDTKLASYLGIAIIEGLSEFHNDCIVMYNNRRFVYRPIGELIDEKTGRIPTRYVDVKGEEYRIMKKYQCQVLKDDFKNRDFVNKAAEILKVSPEQFQASYGYLANICVL